MTGRYRDIDVNHEVARETREALASASPDGLFVAEHMHDARYDLGARGWQGVMNYSGCLVPIWAWLSGSAPRGRVLRHDHVRAARRPGRRRDDAVPLGVLEQYAGN